MLTSAAAFAVAAAAATGLTPLVRDLACRRGALDLTFSSRKIHSAPVPRVGGIAIVAAFLLATLGLAVADHSTAARLLAEPREAAGLVLGALAIAALGIYDDLRGANPKMKLAVQFAVAAGAYAAGFRINAIDNPFGAPVQLGMLSLPFTMLWIAGVVNAMNLIDGLDGLAAGVSFIAVVTFFALGALRGDALVLVFTAALGGAVLGFLVYNFNPASIFMGDTGSMFLGFILATTAIQPDHGKSPTSVSLLVPVLILGVPITDTLLAMGRRALRGLPVFSADRGHIHHRLLDRGLTQRQTVLVLYGASLVLGVAGVVLAFGSPSQALAFLAGLAVLGVAALRRLGFFHLAKTRRVLAARRRNLEMQGHVRRAGQSLRDAGDQDEVWMAVRFAARQLGASAVALRLPLPRPMPCEPFTYGFDDDAELLVGQYGLDPERPGDTMLELGWRDGRTAIDRDTEIAVEILCGEVADALERIAATRRTGLRVVSSLRRSGTDG